jgi:membrane protein required for colicin V production
MIWVDWVLLGLLAVSTIIGLWRGLVREVMSILIWVVAIWAALKYSELAAGYLSGWITVPSMQALVGFAGVLLVTLAVGGLLVWMIGKMVDSTGLSGTDRTFGMLFGIARGVIIVAVAVLVARFTAIPEDPWWQESTLLPHFERIADEGITLLPEDIQDMLEPDPESIDTDAGDDAATELSSAAASRSGGSEQATAVNTRSSGNGVNETMQARTQDALRESDDGIDNGDH